MHLAVATCPGTFSEMMYTLVRLSAAKTAPLRVPVAVTYRVEKFSKQAFSGRCTWLCPGR